MKESWEEEGREETIGTVVSDYGVRQEILRSFRAVKRLLWAILAIVLLSLGAVVLFSGSRRTIVALTSDGAMHPLRRLSDQAFERNFQRIVRFFVTDFLSNLTAYDSQEISYRLEKALQVMSPGLRGRMRQEIVARTLVEGVKNARIHTLLTVRTLTLHSVTSGVWTLAVTGVRTTYPYAGGLPREAGFSARIMIRKGEATAFNPYGLWVSQYGETPVTPPSGGSP